MAHPEVDPRAPPPGQNPELWGHELFTEISQTADWCTIRQAAELRELNIPPDNHLLLIAQGRMESSVYTPDEAWQLLQILARKQQQE